MLTMHWNRDAQGRLAANYTNDAVLESWTQPCKAPTGKIARPSHLALISLLLSTLHLTSKGGLL